MRRCARAITLLEAPALPSDHFPQLAGVAGEFLAWRAPGAATVKTYASVLRLFGSLAQCQPPAPFGELVRRWVRELVQLGKWAATVELHAVTLRQFRHYLVKEGRLTAGRVGDDLVVRPGPRPACTSAGR